MALNFDAVIFNRECLLVRNAVTVGGVQTGAFLGCPMTFSDQVEAWFCHQLGALDAFGITQLAWIFMVLELLLKLDSTC